MSCSDGGPLKFDLILNWIWGSLDLMLRHKCDAFLKIGAAVFFGVAATTAVVAIVKLYFGTFPFLLELPPLHHLVLLALVCFAGALLLKTRRFYQGGLLFAIIWAVYLGPGTILSVGDTQPARHLPLSILRDGDFYLDEAKNLYERGVPYYLRKVDEHYVSNYPVGAAIVATPFYAISALGPVEIENRRFLATVERFAASGIVALSALLLFHALRIVTSLKISFWIAIIYAFCTSSLSNSSQALWQHGPSQLGFALAIYCLLKGRTNSKWIWVSGFAVAMIVVCRPQNLPLVLPIVAYVLFYHFRQLAGFIAFALPGAVFQLWYNHTYFHDLFHTQFSLFAGYLWTTPFWYGLAGILFSPARGLFIYSPILLLSIPGIIWACREKSEPLFRFLSISVLMEVVLYAKFTMWWGGWSYGPRLLSDITPILSFLLFPWIEKSAVQKWKIALVLIFSIWSAFAHINGAYIDDRKWNGQKQVDKNTAALWLWTDNPLINPTRRMLTRSYARLRNLPTNHSDPGLVNAEYKVKMEPIVMESMEVQIQITNRGKAVWLGWPKEDNAVRLRWRWNNSNDRSLGKLREQLFLNDDKFPGESVTFFVNVQSPSKPGLYFLEMGLSDETGWLPDQEHAPLKFRVLIDLIDGRKIHKIRLLSNP